MKHLLVVSTLVALLALGVACSKGPDKTNEAIQAASDCQDHHSQD